MKRGLPGPCAACHVTVLFGLAAATLFLPLLGPFTGGVGAGPKYEGEGL